MQTHLQHQGERYYEEALSIRNYAENVALAVVKRGKTPRTDSTLADLEALHRLVKSPGGKRRAKQPAAKPAAPAEPDLFSPA